MNDYQCDGCGDILNEEDVKSVFVYGCEGTFCSECRGDSNVVQSF